MRPFDRSIIRWLRWGRSWPSAFPSSSSRGRTPAPIGAPAPSKEMADSGLETGFPDGSFLAADPLTGYHAAVLIDRLLAQVAARAGCAAPAPAAAVFVDVPGDHWAAGAVAQVAALDDADAFPEGRFDGNATLTGYQTALLVARARSSADDQVDGSERSSAEVVAAMQTEVGALQTAIGEMRTAITGGSLQDAAGPEGPPGPSGPAGADGVAGPPGDVGPRGLDGPIGPVGPVGAIGPVGPGGPAGADGQSDADGHAGWDRSGDGLPGLDEDVNLDGVWDALDCVGRVGPAGLAGPEGPQGPVGERGAVGPVGPEGEQGPTGATGPQGPQGEVGPQGAMGPHWPRGPSG